MDVDAALIKNLIPYIGVPGVMLLVMIYALHKKWIVMGSHVSELNVSKEQYVAFMQKSYEAALLEKKAICDKMEEDKDKWENMALRSLHVADAAVKTTEKGAELAEKGLVRK
jgi:hypothetical protein